MSTPATPVNEPTAEAGPIICPRCGSTNVYMPQLRTGRDRWFTKEMFLLIFGISAPDPAYPHYRCRNCREWWMKKGFAG